MIIKESRDQVQKALLPAVAVANDILKGSIPEHPFTNFLLKTEDPATSGTRLEDLATTLVVNMLLPSDFAALLAFARLELVANETTLGFHQAVRFLCAFLLYGELKSRQPGLSLARFATALEDYGQLKRDDYLLAEVCSPRRFSQSLFLLRSY